MHPLKERGMIKPKNVKQRTEGLDFLSEEMKRENKQLIM